MMLEEPALLSPWERDKLRLSFTKWLSKKAARFHCDGEQIIAVIVPQAASVAAPPLAAGSPVGELKASLVLGDGVKSTHYLGGAASQTTNAHAPVVQPDGGGPADSTARIPQTSGAPHTADPTPKDDPRDEGRRTGGEVEPDLAATHSSLPVTADDGEGQRNQEALPEGFRTGESIAARLRALNAEHPELDTRDVANRLGLTLTQVRTNSYVHAIVWARSDGRRLRTRQGPVSARSPAPAPEHAPEPERPPAPPRAPVATIPSGTGSAVVTKPMQRAPKGTRFVLRDDAGLYLHYGCASMTSNKQYAWSGTQYHLVACRMKFPLARDLREQVVEKEPAGAVV